MPADFPPLPRSDRPSNPYVVIFALWLLVFASSSQIMIIAPILSIIGTALSIPEPIRGTLITAYGVLVGVFALIIGPISDKVGRRQVLLAGTGAMAVALVLHLFVVNYATMMLARALAGMSGGILSGAAVSYVGDYFPYNRRGWANGWIMSGIAFGQIIGIPLGTVLADQFGFRSPFLLFAVMMALAFALIWWGVPQPDVQRSRGPLTVGGALRNYRDLLRRGDIRAACFVYFLLFLSVAFYIVYLPTWLEATLDFSGTTIATMFFAGGIASVFTGPQAGKLSDRFGRKPLIILSCLGLAGVMVATPLVVRSVVSAHVLFFAAMVLISMRISPLQALLSELVGGERRGSLLSLAVSIGQGGIGIGGALAGVVYTGYGFTADTVVAGVSLVVMVVVVWRLLPEPRLEPPEPVPVSL